MPQPIRVHLLPHLANPNLAIHLLPHLANPNLAIPLLLCGILLIYAEFNLPGTVLPGSLGAFLTMLALFGLSRLPLHPFAIALLAAGLALLLLALKRLREAQSPTPPLSPSPWTFPTLAVAGTATIVYGLTKLTVTPRIHPIIALATGTTFAAVTLWLGRIALLARRNKSIVARAPHLQPLSAPIGGVD